MDDYYDCSNLPFRFSDESQFHAEEKVSLPELLAALQKEINSHIESLRGNGCPKQKIVDLATLIDIMLEKDLDRLDRMLLYRLSSQNGRFDPRLFQWLESLAMAYWFHQLTEDDLSRLLSQLAYPSTENSKSGAETLNSHSKEVELTPASGKSDGGADRTQSKLRRRRSTNRLRGGTMRIRSGWHGTSQKSSSAGKRLHQPPLFVAQFQHWGILYL
jgi:hypothetical protein